MRERVKGVRFPNVPRRTHGFVFISACDSIGLARFEVGPVERNPLNYAHALAAAGLAPSLMLAASAAFASGLARAAARAAASVASRGGRWGWRA